MTQKKKMRRHETVMVTAEEANPSWIILDAKGKTLGRFAAEVAKILRGKHKPTFTPHIDGGDGVIVLNADKIAVTGNKEAGKTYRRYTGFIGGSRETNFRTVMQRKPTYPIEHAVKGMMPRTRLGRKQLKRLRLFVGEEHDLHAQKPVKVEV